ncbi:MAG: hypothetical protein ACI3X1_01115 [Eubacteriales bacterium]
MTKALFKKQIMEVFSWLYKDRKTGKHRSAQGILMYALLYLVVFGFLGFVFYGMAEMLCEPLVSSGMGFVYWCLMGLIGIFLGVFGSVFSTYSSLYRAKDNDFLLSMPIPVSRILAVRLFGVYAVGLIYELIVMVPTVIVWFIKAPFSPVGAVCAVLVPFVLSVFVLVLSAILGWVVALISGKLKHKNIITVIISLAFIAAYYYFYSQAYSMLQMLLQNVEEVGDKIKVALYPLYQMGLAAQGDLLSMLIFTAIIGALFSLVYFVLSRSFLRLATANRGVERKAYKNKEQKAGSLGGALLKKELRRFLGSANYMLNCGLGIILMPIAAVLLFWQADTLLGIINEPFLQKYIPLLAVAAICMIATMNDMTSPSVSLEGKNIWLVQSFPILSRQVLAAKIKMHVLLTVIPAIPLIIAVEWLIKPELHFAIFIPIAVVLFIVLMASFGLFMNLKMPNLNWTNEIVPIKQSLSVMISLFGGWVIIMALAGLYALLSSVLSPFVYLLLACALLLALCAVLIRWIFTRGADIFATL